MARIGDLCDRRQSMKFGYQGGFLKDNQFSYTERSNLVVVPLQRRRPESDHREHHSLPLEQRVRYDSFYGQEQWTIGRMTLQGALRFDRAWSYFPEVTVRADTVLRDAGDV